MDRAGYVDVGPHCLMKFGNFTGTVRRWLRLSIWRLQPAGEAAGTDIRPRCRLSCICITLMVWAESHKRANECVVLLSHTKQLLAIV